MTFQYFFDKNHIKSAVYEYFYRKSPEIVSKKVYLLAFYNMLLDLD